MLRDRKYAQDYQEIKGKGKNGKEKAEYFYTGSHYILQIPDDQYQRILVQYMVLCLAVVLLFVAAGLLNTESSRTFYVAMPFACTIIPILYLVMGTVRLVRGERSKKQKDYDYSVVRIHRSAAGALVLMAMSSLGEIMFLIRGFGKEIPIGEILFLVFVTAAFVVLLFLQNLRKKYSVTEAAGEKLPEAGD